MNENIEIAAKLFNVKLIGKLPTRQTHINILRERNLLSSGRKIYDDNLIKNMKINQLKEQLILRGLTTTGNKSQLLLRLLTFRNENFCYCYFDSPVWDDFQQMDPLDSSGYFVIVMDFEWAKKRKSLVGGQHLLQAGFHVPFHSNMDLSFTVKRLFVHEDL